MHVTWKTAVLVVASSFWGACASGRPSPRSSAEVASVEPSGGGEAVETPPPGPVATPVVDPAVALVEALPNGAHPSEGVFTSGQPSAQDLSLTQAAGVRTVVNLRPESEMELDERAAVEALGMHYVHIPIAGAGDLTLENAKALDAALESEGAALVHCGSSNRVGALFALRAAWLQEETAEEALQVGREHGLASLEGAVEERLASAPAE